MNSRDKRFKFQSQRGRTHQANQQYMYRQYPAGMDSYPIESLLTDPKDRAMYNEINKIGVNNNPYATCCKLHDSQSLRKVDIHACRKLQPVKFSLKFSSISDKKDLTASMRQIFVQAWNLQLLD